MVYVYWSAGIVLALAWFSRIVDAGSAFPRLADISKSHWDRQPNRTPREHHCAGPQREEDIEECLRELLSLDYDNYECWCG